jgi:hypothetical protein
MLIGPASLQYKFIFDVGIMGRLKRHLMDVATGSTQAMPLHHGLIKI